MKIISIFLLLLFTLSCSSLKSQDLQNDELNLNNPEYVEWVSKFGFKFMGETKSGEATYLASEILDSEGNSIPENVIPATFDLTKYDFETVVYPERNIIIKVSEDKSIFIYSRKRQDVLFKRYLINKSAKK